eukprot:1838517-Amphidinium_carterae.1
MHVAACLGASKYMLLEVHSAQARAYFGQGVCPHGSTAVWMTNMHPAPRYRMCARSDLNCVDSEIMRKGHWGNCLDLAHIVRLVMRSPGLVVDAGANIGTCTTMLAVMGHS